MLPYALIDLHCDTLTALLPEDAPLLAAFRDPARRREATAVLVDRVRGTNTLDLPGRHFSLSALPEEVRWCQCCAIFIPDGLTQEEAVAYYGLHQRNFRRQMEALSEKVLPCRTAGDIESAWAMGKTAAILTVENGSALAGRLDRVETLAQDGVRMMTLTWNGENELGSGNVTDHGLSPFGREAIRELERVNFHQAFLGITGYHPVAGFTCGISDEAFLKQTAIRQSDQVIVLMDSSKIDVKCSFTICGLEDIDIVVSDGKLPEEFLSQCRARGVRVL